MPLFEYECRECGTRFEAFVAGSRKPSCPACGSEDLEKQLSRFGVGGFSSSSGGFGTSSSNCSSGGG
jgi:putative FmdB family regulatory protein